ncbi:hypothetical protein [Azotobacter salinestris]|uniref:hypothetical protein n=1 Tax=Azotobacter salinestris TaxID=69964 RepID=UPI00142EFE31|nr:hypothetical protein [Azotobacter salinestris]
MRQINECDPCLEARKENEANRHNRRKDVFTRCLEVGMLLVYGTAFLGLLF